MEKNVDSSCENISYYRIILSSSSLYNSRQLVEQFASIYKKVLKTILFWRFFLFDSRVSPHASLVRNKFQHARLAALSFFSDFVELNKNFQAINVSSIILLISVQGYFWII